MAGLKSYRALRCARTQSLSFETWLAPALAPGAMGGCAGNTLIELAEEHSVAINFGCRAGSCGTCATRLLSGEVLPCIAVPAEPLVLDV